MKFFFISCCGVTLTARAGRTASSSSISPPSRGATTMSPARGLSTSPHGMASPAGRRLSNSRAVRQTRSELAPIPQRPRRKCGRPVGSAASALPYSDWTPSLCTIAEDNVVIVRKSVGDRSAGVERAVKIKSGRDISRVHGRSQTDDYGRASVTIVPAFSPTPFMF